MFFSAFCALMRFTRFYFVLFVLRFLICGLTVCRLCGPFLFVCFVLLCFLWLEFVCLFTWFVCLFCDLFIYFCGLFIFTVCGLTVCGLCGPFLFTRLFFV